MVPVSAAPSSSRMCDTARAGPRQQRPQRAKAYNSPSGLETDSKPTAAPCRFKIAAGLFDQRSERGMRGTGLFGLIQPRHRRPDRERRSSATATGPVSVAVMPQCSDALPVGSGAADTGNFRTNNGLSGRRRAAAEPVRCPKATEVGVRLAGASRRQSKPYRHKTPSTNNLCR